MHRKSQILSDLRLLLRDVLLARRDGATHQKIARAQGHVDGYMKCLLDHDLATNRELLALVAEERARVAGPSTRVLQMDDVAGAA